MKITLDTPPSANRYWRMGNNRIYRSDEAVNYRAYVELLCNTAGIEPLDSNVALYVDVYRPAKRGDLDNFLKVLGDSLQGYAYHNDAQIVEIHARRYDDPRNPRVEITVEAL